MAEAAPATCVNHRRRPRVATCATCGNALCADCIVRTGVGVKCPNCTGVKAVKPSKAEKEPAPPVRVAATTSGGTRALLAPAGRGRPRWAVPVLVVGAVVLAMASYGIVSRDSGTSAPPEQAQSTPAAFTERQSEFVGAGGQRIGGTLTLPGAGDAVGVPGVLIVPGLGALDRNSVVAANPPDALRDALVTTVGGVGLSSGDPLYRDLSEALARVGVASFRYDRRGMQPIPLTNGQKLSFDDEMADARGALDLLGRRQEVIGAPLAVLGQDVGAIVATRLAAGNTRVKAVVALSLPSRPLSEVLAADLTRSRGAPVGDAFKAAVATLTSTTKAPAVDSLPDILRPIFAPGDDAYLAAVLVQDPMVAVNRVDQPVLLVRGGGDPAVTAEDSTRLSSQLRTGGQVMVASADADHNLTLAGPGHEHSNTPTAQVTHRDTDVIGGLTTWVKANLAG